MAASVEDVIQDTKNTDAFLGDMQTLHRRRLRNAIKKAEGRIVNLMKRLETTDSGRLEGIKVNLKQAQRIHKDMVKVFAEEYNVPIRELVGEFDEISRYIQKSWKSVGESIHYTGIDKDMIDVLKQQDLAQYQQYGLEAQRRIATAMYDQIVGGAGFAQLLNTVRGVMRGHEDVRGVPMEVHAETHAQDAVMNYHNQVNLKKGEDLGLKHFLYVGDIITTSRRFCITRAMKVYTRRQIDSWNRLDWAGKRGPAYEYRGGWRCRHHWRPVRPEWIKEDEEGEFGEVTEDEMFAMGEADSYPEIKGAVTDKEALKKKYAASQAQSKALKAERAKLKAKETITAEDKARISEITKINKGMMVERKELKAQIGGLKKDIGKQGKKLKRDISAGRTPKAAPRGAPTTAALEKEMHAKNKELYNYTKKGADGDGYRKWTDSAPSYNSGHAPARKAYALHNEAFEANMDWYRSLPRERKIAERAAIIEDLIGQSRTGGIPARKVIAAFTKGTDHMSYRLMSELQRGGVKIEWFSGAGRASWGDGVVHMYAGNNYQVMAHELGHAIDSMMANGARAGWGDTGLLWRNEGRMVGKAQRNKIRRIFKKQCTGGRGDYGFGGDGQYYRGNWIRDYEGRIYARPKSYVHDPFLEGEAVIKKAKALEGFWQQFWSMNCERYATAVAEGNKAFTVELKRLNRSIKDLKKSGFESAKDQIADLTRQRTDLLDKDVVGYVQDYVRTNDSWLKVRKTYPEMADYVEDFFQNITAT